MPKPISLAWSDLRGLTKQIVPAGLHKPLGKVVRAFRKPPAPLPVREPSPAELDGEIFGWFNSKAGELMPGFSIGPKDTVVDVGCGHGMYSTFCASLGAEVISVDADPNTVARMRHNFEAMQARRFEVHLTQSSPLPIPAGRATRVLAQEVMEHVEDPPAFLAELHRIGGPGALYLISVPDPIGESVMKKIAPASVWVKPEHINIFERDEFASLVRNAGLEIVRREHYGFYWTMWWILMWGSETSAHGEERHLAAPLHFWNKTWAALIQTEKGRKVRTALEAFMPKSQIIIARKPR